MKKLWISWSPKARGRLVGLAFFLGVIGFLSLYLASPLRQLIFGDGPAAIVARVENIDQWVVGKEAKCQVEISNRSNLPTKIVGITDSCSCLNFDENLVPQVIPPNGKLTLPFSIKPYIAGPIHQRVILFLDHPKHFRMHIDVVGSAIEDEE